MRKQKIVFTRKSLSIEDAIPMFIASKMAGGVSEKTIQTYKGHFRCVGHHIDYSISFDELTKKNLDDMLVSIRSSGVSPNTLSSYARVFRTFLKWCRSEGMTELSIPNIQDKETVKGFYSDEELLILLKKPSKDCDFCEFRNWVIINFLLNSGCRAATVRNIQNQDHSLADRQVIFRHTKNGKVQCIPLCSQLVKILQEYTRVRGGKSDDYLFCNEYGEMMTERALILAVRKYNHRRGVEKTSLHLFRHTFARKYLVDCGGDALVLQKLLGHSTLAMTKRYCAIYDADIASNYDCMFCRMYLLLHGGISITLRAVPSSAERSCT